MSIEPGAAAHPIVRAMSRLTSYLTQELGGGRKVLKMAWVINTQKAGSLLFVAFLMWWYDNYSTVAWVYLALYGTYGLCWLLKDALFPDRNWEKRVTFAGALMIWVLVLGLYWVLPWLLISDVLGSGRTPVPPALLAVAIGLHTIGVVVMMASDAQKYFTLRLRPGLIEEGMFSRVRHPNYLGEMMLYAAYGLLVGHWIAWAILLWVWGGVFLVNMLMKEASLSRFPGWAAYRARTGMLLPRLVPAQGAARPGTAAAPDG